MITVTNTQMNRQRKIRKEIQNENLYRYVVLLFLVQNRSEIRMAKNKSLITKTTCINFGLHRWSIRDSCAEKFTQSNESVDKSCKCSSDQFTMN